MTERLYFGIDAGNSKTHGLIADATGHVLALAQAGCGNWEVLGLDGVGEVYRDVLEDALSMAGRRKEQLAAAGYGLAGHDFPSDAARLRPVIEALGVPGPSILENDTLIALRAGTARPYGVVCIAGAGSTKAGRNRQGQVFRTWGLSSEMGDWGSGGWLFEQAVGWVARAEKGMDMSTDLTALLLAHYNVPDVRTAIEQIVRGQDYRLDFVPRIFVAAEAGDPAAVQLLLEAGRKLALGVNAVIRALKMEDDVFELVLAGGIFRASYSLLCDTLMASVQAVAPRVEVVRLTAPPVVGAVLLAMDEDGLPPDDTVRDRLIAEVLARLGDTPRSPGR